MGSDSASKAQLRGAVASYLFTLCESFCVPVRLTSRPGSRPLGLWAVSIIFSSLSGLNDGERKRNY